MTQPKCPRCGRIKAVRPEGDNYRCTVCRALFDPSDDGDYSDRNPAARMEREERRKVR